MKPSPQQLRWAAYALAGMLTAAAVVAVRDEPPPLVLAVPAPRTPRAPTPEPLQAPRARSATPLAGDPFAVMDDAPAVVRTAQHAAPAAAPPPQAPALPFSYLGRWQEQGRSVVYLQRGGRTYKVEGAGPLDADYDVLAVEAQRITLRYLPLGQAQELRFDTPAPAVAAAPAPSTPPPEPARQEEN